MSNQNKFSPEIRERAVRMVQENLHEYRSLWAAAVSIGPKFRCVPATLIGWVKRAVIDAGLRPGVSSEEQTSITDLERKFKRFARTDESIKPTSQCVRRAG